MSSRRRSDPEEEELSEEEDDEEGTKASGSGAHPKSARSAKGRSRASPEAVATWDPDADAAAAGKDWLGRPKRPVYWRARDSLWFEPLVALMIVVVLVAGLYAYTQNWPPLYVVESDSMQHGDSDIVGLINTGDLVLAQKIDPSAVTTYVAGAQSGYTTYGEYGDVILYYPNGAIGTTPVIHRSIIFLSYTGADAWSFPSLAAVRCFTGANGTTTPAAGSGLAYSVTGPQRCAVAGVGSEQTLTLYNVGWQGATVSIPLIEMGDQSGFVTMGDNNFVPGSPATGEPDQTYGISALVQPGWVLGVARGMIPWFGALKLALEADTSMVPVQSWQFLGLTIAGIILLALGVHLALRRHAARRRDDDGEEAAGGGGWFGGLFHRSEAEDAPETDEDEVDRPKHKVKPVPKDKLLPRHKGAAGGRPRPKVRRTAASSKAPSRSDGSSDEL